MLNICKKTKHCTLTATKYYTWHSWQVEKVLIIFSDFQTIINNSQSIFLHTIFILLIYRFFCVSMMFLNDMVLASLLLLAFKSCLLPPRQWACSARSSGVTPNFGPPPRTLDQRRSFAQRCGRTTAAYAGQRVPAEVTWPITPPSMA